MISSKRILAFLGVALTLAFVIASCGREAAPAAEVAPAEVAPADEAPSAGGEAAVEVSPDDSERVAAKAKLAPTPARTGDEKLAPELEGIVSWINSEPFTLESQRGKVVLIDFWTYTCINCIRTLPYLREWQEKYSDRGLVIVGVHTPEFEFEKKTENVIQAADEYGLEYAIAQDNDYATWKAFSNRYWPAKYLIDKDGYIRYTHFGEGKYKETEEKIRELLMESAASVSGIALGSPTIPSIDPAASGGSDPMTGQTRELYTGVERNYGALQSGQARPYVLHSEFYQMFDSPVEYKDPGDHSNHFIYLQGLWHNGLESLRHARATKDYEDYMAILFYATSVNIVMSPEGGEPFQVMVTIDGAPLKPTQAGVDITFDADGKSFVMVNESRMYRVVKMPEFGGHEMKLSSNSDDFSVFAFTFGAFVEES